MFQAQDYMESVSVILSGVLSDKEADERIVRTFKAPDYIEQVSVKLSEVLSDIGVDERIVLKRRKAALLTESMDTRTFQLLDSNITSYYFGSQSEGTTTHYLKSDSDTLMCLNDYNVIQKRSERKVGVDNYLMIQDGTVSPGYCLLEYLSKDTSLSYHTVSKKYASERKGKILIKNTIMSAMGAAVHGGIQHGPAQTLPKPGFHDMDMVTALPCKSWPLQARQWLDWQGVGQWPSADMRRKCGGTLCFLVGVGSKGSEHEELEWRISTSLAERILMFSLNITQIRCYILMKMILKTFIKPYFEDTISSFMCKTVMFHCIANTHSNIWKENNILGCLSLCLFVLHNCILNETCPHFIIPGNNLMRGNIPGIYKPYILQKLRALVTDRCTALQEIECEDLGVRLQLKINNLSPIKVSDIISGHILKSIAIDTDCCIKSCLTSISNSSNKEAVQKLLKYIFKLADISNQCEEVDKTACCLLARWFCTYLGTALASQSIQLCNTVSAKALTMISLSLNTDAASSKLKLASIYYCVGNTQKTEITLRNIERSYDLNTVEPICCCYDFIRQAPREEFLKISNDRNEEAIQHITAFCISFPPYEIKCVPHELKYEMFRSTKADLAFRPPDDHWIKWAMVDSLPYLYFLQYKTYRCLGRQDEKKTALSNLLRTTDREPDLGHRETALNLLGQCMEQEDRATDALCYYLKSLNLRETYNVAKIHICRLISSLLTSREQKRDWLAKKS